MDSSAKLNEETWNKGAVYDFGHWLWLIVHNVSNGVQLSRAVNQKMLHRLWSCLCYRLSNSSRRLIHKLRIKFSGNHKCLRLAYYVSHYFYPVSKFFLWAFHFSKIKTPSQIPGNEKISYCSNQYFFLHLCLVSPDLHWTTLAVLRKIITLWGSVFGVLEKVQLFGWNSLPIELNLMLCYYLH